jgi:hypothetical protein
MLWSHSLVPQAAPVEIFSWTGIYLGVHVGAAL